MAGQLSFGAGGGYVTVGDDGYGVGYHYSVGSGIVAGVGIETVTDWQGKTTIDSYDHFQGQA